MNRTIYTIQEIRDIVSPIAVRHGINKVFLFGSYARGEATPLSDLDFHIDAPEVKTMFQIGAVYADLEEAFQKKLDLITSSSLKYSSDKLFLRNLLTEEKIVYTQYASDHKGNRSK